MHCPTMMSREASPSNDKEVSFDPNHAYPVKHKLKDCGMMQSFMTSGSLTWGTDLNEGHARSDMVPFPKENASMIVFEGCSHWIGACHVQPRPQDPNSRLLGPWQLMGVMTHTFLHMLLHMCQEAKQKIGKEKRRGSVPWSGAGVPCFLQVLQYNGDHWYDFLGYLQKLGNVLNRQQAYRDSCSASMA
jgi:hypothetical protein